VLNRLAGLETEYAIRYRPADEPSRLSRFRLYQRLVGAVRQVVLTVRAHHFKEGVFTANGGAIWFESERPAGGAGLIEGSTPECRGPRQLVAYQRAQDRLVARAAAAAGVEGDFGLIKVDRDAQGNVFGAQENYDVPIARGWRLWAWRAGLIGLFPFVLLSWAGFGLLILMLLAYLGAAGMVYMAFRRLAREPRALALALFGRDLVEGRETGAPTPAWVESIVLNATRVLSAPLAIALFVHCRLFAFREIRRGLTAFLASRCVVSGSGYVDMAGNFQLADKAPAMNCLVGFGGFLRDRPVYTMGHFFKTLCVECVFSPRAFASLFAPRQRLQIALGDSNMCEISEWLKVGTTMFVLDAIEAGVLRKAPVLRNPIPAFRAFAADAGMDHAVALRGGRTASALDLQRYYLDACRRFARHHPATSREAVDLLECWERTLDAITAWTSRPPSERSSAAPLVGVLDWATKRYLLDQLGDGVSWAQRKKVDLRYHELSEEGYFHQLVTAGVVTRVVTDEEVERAVRVAPPDSPATMRGHFLREFGDAEIWLGVNWRTVTLGRGRGAKVVRLDRYHDESGRRTTKPRRPRRASPDRS